MIEKIEKHISEKKLFSKYDNLLLAVSGGADSVALFYSLRKLGYQFEVAHCNFNLRGKESDQDEFFIKDLANKYDVKFHIKHFKTQEYADANKISIQMAARDLRYGWFNELIESQKLDLIVPGHHKDDNIETFLINLIRGSGIHGLTGIKYKNKKIIRPLLEISRDEIYEYLVSENIKYREDSSNKEFKYLRNKIRHKLIPILNEMNPNITNRISEQMSILAGVNRIFQMKINELSACLVSEERGVYKINTSALFDMQDSEVLLFEILRPFGFTQTDQIFKAIRSQSGKKFFSKTHQLIIDRDEILILFLKNVQKEFVLIDSEAEIHTPFKMKFFISEDLFFSKNPHVAYLDFTKLSFPLMLRKWKNGDKFIPFGMRNFKKLSDFFIDEKYSILDKQSQWLLCSGDDIVWIVGKRIDDRYKIETQTKKAYIAKVLKTE